MDIINQFLQEDMLITRPSVFIYIENYNRNKVINDGIYLGDGKIDAFLTRLPEDCEHYQKFLSTHSPVRITLSKLKKIRSQIVKLIPKKMDAAIKMDLKDDNNLDKLIKKYSCYLNTCYKDGISIENLPHIEMRFSGGFIPGFVCKVLDT
jgi:hypothetical protein